jgi:hypothetical protein
MTTRRREAEIALGARSRHKAEAELKLVDSARFAKAITEFIEWRTFAYWVRLVVEIDGGMSSKMQAILEERCPGFIGALTAYRAAHPDEREFLWLRLIEWIDHNISESANAEGWRHALGFYAARDPRLVECGSIGFSVTMPGNASPRQNSRRSMIGGRPPGYPLHVGQIMSVASFTTMVFARPQILNGTVAGPQSGGTTT